MIELAVCVMHVPWETLHPFPPVLNQAMCVLFYPQQLPAFLAEHTYQPLYPKCTSKLDDLLSLMWTGGLGAESVLAEMSTLVIKGEVWQGKH